MFFRETFELDKFEGVDLEYDISLLKLYSKNAQIRHFRSQILAFLFFRKILQLDKFEGADFKYDNSFLNPYPKNTQIRSFWPQI